MLGERIRLRRELLGLSQKELAEKIHVAASTVNRYENGVYDPASSTLSAISVVLGTSSDYLLGLADNPTAEILKDPNLEIWLRATHGLLPEDRAELLRFVDWLADRRKRSEPPNPANPAS